MFLVHKAFYFMSVWRFLFLLRRSVILFKGVVNVLFGKDTQLLQYWAVWVNAFCRHLGILYCITCFTSLPVCVCVCVQYPVSVVSCMFYICITRVILRNYPLHLVQYTPLYFDTRFEQRVCVRVCTCTWLSARVCVYVYVRCVHLSVCVR